MVICAVIGCMKQSKRAALKGHASNSKVSFYRFPAVTDYYGEKDFELRKKHLAGYLVAVSRDDINPSSIKEHDYRVCSHHFVSGQPADLYNVSNPDWLPAKNIGHKKQAKGDQVSTQNVKRHERAAERGRKRKVFEEMVNELPGIVSEPVDEIVSEEAELITSEEVQIGMQYFKVGTHRESSECQRGCASKINDLQKELAQCKLTIERLTNQLDNHPAPFSEKSFVSNEYMKFNTGLPNFKLVKAVFDHVSKGLPPEGAMKLTYF